MYKNQGNDYNPFIGNPYSHEVKYNNIRKIGRRKTGSAQKGWGVNQANIQLECVERHYRHCHMCTSDDNRCCDNANEMYKLAAKTYIRNLPRSESKDLSLFLLRKICKCYLRINNLKKVEKYFSLASKYNYQGMDSSRKNFPNNCEDS